MRQVGSGEDRFFSQFSALLPEKSQVQEAFLRTIRLAAAAAVALKTHQMVMSSSWGRLEVIPLVGLIQSLKFACLSGEVQPSFAVEAIRWSQALLGGVAVGAASASLTMGAQHLEAAKLDCKISIICKAIFDVAWALGDPGASSWHLFSKSFASEDALQKEPKTPSISFRELPGRVLASNPHFFSRIVADTPKSAEREPTSILSRIDRAVDLAIFAFLSSAQIYFFPKPVLCGLLMGSVSLVINGPGKTFKPDPKFFRGSFAECMRSIATESRSLAFVDELGWIGGILSGKDMIERLWQYWSADYFKKESR